MDFAPTILSYPFPEYICELDPQQPMKESNPQGTTAVGNDRVVLWLNAYLNKPSQAFCAQSYVDVGVTTKYTVSLFADDVGLFFIDCKRIAQVKLGVETRIDVTLSPGRHQLFFIWQNIGHHEYHPCYMSLYAYVNGVEAHRALAVNWRAMELNESHVKALIASKTAVEKSSNDAMSACAALLFGGNFKIPPSTTTTTTTTTTAKPTPPPCINPPLTSDAHATYQPRMKVQYENGWGDEGILVTQTKTDFAKKINDMYLSSFKRPADQSGLRNWVSVAAGWSDALLKTEIEKSYNSSEAYFGKILGYYSFCEWSKMDTSQKAAAGMCGCLHGSELANPKYTPWHEKLVAAFPAKESGAIGFLAYVRKRKDGGCLEVCGSPYANAAQLQDLKNYNQQFFTEHWEGTAGNIYGSIEEHVLTVPQMKAWFTAKKDCPSQYILAQYAHLVDKFCGFLGLPGSFNLGAPSWIWPQTKACAQNPRETVHETYMPAGGAWEGSSEVRATDYYALHVQPNIKGATSNTFYLIQGTVNIPQTNRYTFDFFSDDDYELYVNCDKVSQGSFGKHRVDVNLVKGPINLIFRYKNIPTNTPGYIAFNIYLMNTLVYTSRAKDFKGTSNSISIILT